MVDLEAYIEQDDKKAYWYGEAKAIAAKPAKPVAGYLARPARVPLAYDSGRGLGMEEAWEPSHFIRTHRRLQARTADSGAVVVTNSPIPVPCNAKPPSRAVRYVFSTQGTFSGHGSPAQSVQNV